MYLVQEPYTVHGRLKDAPRGYNIYKEEGLGVRAAIYCSRNIKAAFMGKYSNQDVVTVLVDVQGYQFYVCSAYSDINKDAVPEKLKELAEFCRKDRK